HEVRNFSTHEDMEIVDNVMEKTNSYPFSSENTDSKRGHRDNKRLSLHDIERAEVESALRRNGWVQIMAARELGITQRQIGYRIKKYNLSRFDAYGFRG
ncbi:MAG: hypothetical protein HQK67_01555, partial [Desulfamplus sp.]|nr:hypothetical protein [Desulfamplus sp.]